MDKEHKKEEYLPEDQDLINQLAEVGNAKDIFAAREREVQEIQIKAILRNRKTADDFNKSTTRFSLILMAFAIIQIIIALMQFALQAAPMKWFGLAITLVLAIIILYVTKSFDKIIK
jgi:uncharacterized membrane protein YcjF (UPF0283 family)